MIECDLASVFHRQKLSLLESMLYSLYVLSRMFPNWTPRDVWTWLRQAASGVSSSYDALLELFECLGSFLKRLEIYTNIPPTPIMTDIVVKMLLELLSVLALATKQIKQGRFSEPTTIYKQLFLNVF